MLNYLKAAALALFLSALAVPALAQGICATNAFGAASAPITSLPYTIGQTDFCLLKVFNSSGAGAVKIPAPGTAGGFFPNFNVQLFNEGSGTLTLTPQANAAGSTPKINGATTITLATGQGATLAVGTDGNWYANTTSGSSGGVNTVPNGGTGQSTLTAHAVLLGEGTSAVGSVGPGTAGQVLYGKTSADPAWGTPASTSSKPNNPSATGSTVGVMMGLAGAITPATSGRIILLISGDVINNTGNDGASVQCAYGTGTAPTNGAAATGTNVGNPVKFINANSATEKVPFTCQSIVTGLTPSTGLWLDLNLAAITGGSATVADVTVSAHEF